MTFRLLGIPDELRLEIEQNGGGTTKAAQLIIENAVQEAQAQTEMALREIQSIVGPHGSLTRIQAGGLRITPGSGMGIFTDGVHKTQIQPNGTLVIGSDIENPATTTEIFFVEDTIYNNEEFGAGDFLIGDNSEDTGNVKWDASEGQLQFRGGTTVEAFMDTDGSLNAGGGNVRISSGGIVILEGDAGQSFLSFYDETGVTEKFVIGVQDAAVNLQSRIAGSSLNLHVELTSGAEVLTLSESGSIDDVFEAILSLGAAGTVLSVGSGEVQIWAGRDGTETVFNEGSFDINFRIESATNTFAFYLDGEGEFVQFFGGTVANFDSGNSEVTLGDVLTVDYGTEKRLEIGADHFFPTRNSSNPNGFWNEANQDMDFTFEGASDASLLKVDAGLNAVGIGGAAESGYKLKVHGKVNLTSGNTYDINGTPAVYELVTRTDSTARTYTAGSWFDIGATIALPTSGGTWIVQVHVQYGTEVWHTYNGAGVISPVWWKAGGTQNPVTFRMEQHNGNDINGSIRFKAGSGSRIIQVSFDTNVVVASGGFVTVSLRRTI